MINRLIINLLAGVVLVAPSAMQPQSIRVADSLLRSGSLARAESMYYAAASARPHDPIARWALGRYLNARGAARVGATLFEESLRFGGEPSIVGRDLVPVYLTIGAFGRLAVLASATPAERARARWLVAHQPHTIAPESVVIVVFHPSTDSAILGRIPLRINGRKLDAVVTARVQGIVISDSATARRLHTFGARRRGSRATMLAVADSVEIAKLTMINYPVTIVRPNDEQPTFIGLDVLGKLAPTFDAKGQHLMLRASGVVPASFVGAHVATWMSDSDLRIMQGGRWLSITRPNMAALLREHRWTLDAKRGQLIFEP